MLNKQECIELFENKIAEVNKKHNFVCDWNDPSQFKFYICFFHKGHGFFSHERCTFKQDVSTKLYFCYDGLEEIKSFYENNKEAYIYSVG